MLGTLMVSAWNRSQKAVEKTVLKSVLRACIIYCTSYWETKTWWKTTSKWNWI